MTTTTVPSKKVRGKGGFTLTEVMIAMVLIGIISSAVFASWGFIARSTVGIAYYTEMNSSGRLGLEVFARDIRMSRGIQDFSDSGMTLIMDDDENELIHYTFDANEGVFLRENGTEEDTLFKNVEELVLTRFTVLRTPAINDLETKQIQLELRMVRQWNTRESSKKIVSARYIMRNKQVST